LIGIIFLGDNINSTNQQCKKDENEKTVENHKDQSGRKKNNKITQRTDIKKTKEPKKK
jgi:hypothetical protein